MAGDLEFMLKDGSHINCSNVKYVINTLFLSFLLFVINEFQGTLIPNMFQQVLEAKTNAKFVLIVEKEATFQRLIDDNFTLKYPAILITVRFSVLT